MFCSDALGRTMFGIATVRFCIFRFYTKIEGMIFHAVFFSNISFKNTDLDWDFATGTAVLDWVSQPVPSW